MCHTVIHWPSNAPITSCHPMHVLMLYLLEVPNFLLPMQPIHDHKSPITSNMYSCTLDWNKFTNLGYHPPHLLSILTVNAMWHLWQRCFLFWPVITFFAIQLDYLLTWYVLSMIFSLPQTYKWHTSLLHHTFSRVMILVLNSSQFVYSSFHVNKLCTKH